MIKNLIIVTAALAASAVALQACTDSKGDSTAVPRIADPVPVQVMALKTASTSTVVKASGQLTTDDETILGFKTSGIVSAVLVKEGDYVKKRQVLATLDLREINAHVSQATHAYQKAKRDLERTANLFADSVATLEHLQNAQTALAVATEQLDAASFNRTYSTIYATANGYVLKKFVNPGQVVDVGDPILLTNNAGDGEWILKIGVSDHQWTSITLQARAAVIIEAFPGKKFDAVVSRKSETTDAQTGAFTVELSVRTKGEKFGSGMFGSAEISVPSNTVTWQIPYEAVLDANDNEGFVFVTNDNKTAIKQSVVIASFDNTSIYVSAGLENWMTLITSGSAYLTDNSPIKIVK
jgi:RND family efflux transporter MFP subunit